MRNIIFLACVLFFNLTVNAQIITKSINSQLVVRNDQGGIYENSNIDLFYKFGNDNLDMKSSKGFLFVPSPIDVKSTIFQGFSVHIIPENWIYLPDPVKDGIAYKNNCSFMYILNGYSAPVENVYEIILIKYNNGESIFMIIGFGRNSGPPRRAGACQPRLVQIPISKHKNQGLTLNRGSFFVSA